MRQVPHNACRFNLSEAQLRPIVDPWVLEKLVDFGERKWMPYQARLTILEGPEMAPQQLTMGRGWRTAQRQCEDVTARVLAAASTAAEEAAAQGPAGPKGDGAGTLADPLAVGVQIAGLLGPDAAALLAAWRAAASSSPGLAPSDALAAAERNLRSQGANAG
jgi:hypothetical protein